MSIAETAFPNGRIECQVLVIGAGPAGAAAAFSAASAGADVLLVDRKRIVGEPVQCAGMLPVAAGRFFGGCSGTILSRINRIKTIYPDGKDELVKAPGFVIDRKSFDRSLVKRAEGAGAGLLLGCRARPDKEGTRLTKRGCGGLVVKARVIIGADGPRSATGRVIGSVNRHFIHAAQETYTNREGLEEPLIVFDRRSPGGYGWLFPAGATVRAGVGIVPGSGISLRQALKCFIEKMSCRGLIGGQVMEISGGPVPVGGPLDCHKGMIVLAGDAAGLANAQTGAGLMSALISGELAGEAAAEAASSGKTGPLADYAAEIRSLLGPTLERARDEHRWLRDRQQQGDADFSHDLRSIWPLSAGRIQKAEEEVEISRA